MNPDGPGWRHDQPESAIAIRLGRGSTLNGNENPGERQARAGVDNGPREGRRRLMILRVRGRGAKANQDHDHFCNRVDSSVGSAVAKPDKHWRKMQEIVATRAVHRLLYRVVQAA
jgi:hypothetical protein